MSQPRSNRSTVGELQIQYLPAPVREGHRWTSLVVLRQAILGQLAYGLLGLVEFLLQLVVPVSLFP